MKMEIDGDAPAQNHSELLSSPGTIKFSQVNRLPDDNETNGSGVSADDFSSVRQSRHFSHQYAHTYFIRLSTLRPILEKRIRSAWPDISLKKISGLCESTSTAGGSPGGTGSPRKVFNSPKKYSISSPKKSSAVVSTTSSAQDEQHGQHIALREDVTVAIIGTVFKQQPDKPSILQELVEEIQLQDRTRKESYISDKDVVVLEDETTRVRLVPTANCGITINGLVNGIVFGVKGKPTIDGRFEVEEVMWATPPPSKWPKLKGVEIAEMVVVSGLGFGSESTWAQLGLLFEHLQGLCGSPYEQQNVIRKRSRLFILGNSLSIDEAITGSERSKVLAQNIKKLDDMLSSLAATMEVFLVTGKDDPVEAMYPQPPLNRLLFPKSTRYSSFHLLSNPCRLTLPLSPFVPSSSARLDLILTDGEPILDALKFSDVTSGLEMGKRFLEWGHLCPTAPDTLPLSPGVEEDIFIIKEQLPNFFLIGNQKQFNSQQFNGTRIISVPRFSETKTAVVVTAENFEAQQLKFDLFC